MKYLELVIFFAVYSFAGWIIEVIYRSYNGKKFINPGFLYGPFVPVYGIGSLFIITLQNFISPVHIIGQFFIYMFILSLIELITGEFFEYFFKMKLWDYSDTPLNFKGKISLPFSLCWAGFALLLVRVIHPFISEYIKWLEMIHGISISSLFVIYLTADIFYSTAAFNRFMRDIAYLYDKYSTLSSMESQRIIDSFKRILEAFPHLNKLLDFNISENIKLKVNSLKEKISDNIEAILNNRIPEEKEYYNIVSDILEHDEFKKLQNFFHHNSSIYDHAKVVSFISYKICKYLKLDYKSAARGGLLHDFFLYDWRNHNEPELAKEKYHGLEHPGIALQNSLKYFELNDVEMDIIVKHMWPLTLIPPRYQESFVVTFADKYVSSKEFIDEFTKKQKIKITDRIRNITDT